MTFEPGLSAEFVSGLLAFGGGISHNRQIHISYVFSLVVYSYGKIKYHLSQIFLFLFCQGCQGFVNQSIGWLNFTHNDYNTLNCSIEIKNNGLKRGVAVISFKDISLRYCR